MAQTMYACPGLYSWTLELENGTQRVLAASSLMSAIAGVLPSPVVGATRGAPIDETDAVAPVLTALLPTSAKIGDPAFTLHVTGTGFRPGCEILWNGAPEPTTLVSPTELTTTVNMATAEVPMPIPIAVRTLGGLVSNTLTFNLQPAA